MQTLLGCTDLSLGPMGFHALIVLTNRQGMGALSVSVRLYRPCEEGLRVAHGSSPLASNKTSAHLYRASHVPRERGTIHPNFGSVRA